MRYTFAKDRAHLADMVAKAIVTVQRAKDKVQVVAVAILKHAHEHGDYSLAEELVNGLGNGINAKGLVEFFVRFGGLVVDEEEGGFTGWQGAEFIQENFTEAKGTMWYDLAPANPWAGYNLEAELVKVINKHDKMLKKLAKLDSDDEDRAKYNLDVSEGTRAIVFNMCDFRVLEEDTTDEQAVAATG